MEVRDRWAEVVRLPERELPLDEAALLISAAANPDLDVAGQLHRLDGLAAEGAAAGGGADAVCRLVFGRLGLKGDVDSYDEPANSYLDRVLDRRRGIPITLSVLLIEIGRRCGVPLEPVGMPGHFLVRDPGAPAELIDAFRGGRRLDRAACERLLQSVAGPGSRLTPGMLAPSDKRAVLARMLLNLDRSFERRDDSRSLAWVSDLRAELPGVPAADRLQLATRLASLGRFGRAAGVLEAVADTVEPSPGRDKMLAEAASLRARLN